MIGKQKSGKFHWRVPEREKSQADDRPNLRVGNYGTYNTEANIPAKYTFKVGSTGTSSARMIAIISCQAEGYSAELRMLGTTRRAMHKPNEEQVFGDDIIFPTLSEAMDWCEQNALSFAREVFVAAKFVLDAIEGNYSEVGTPFDMKAQKEPVGRDGQSAGNRAVSDD